MVARAWHSFVRWIHNTFWGHPLVGAYCFLACTAAASRLAFQSMTDWKVLPRLSALRR